MPRKPVEIDGTDNYGQPRQEYADKIAAMTDAQFVEAARDAIYQAARCANNPRADWHWHVDVCWQEARNRRGTSELYTQAYDRAKKMAGLG